MQNLNPLKTLVLLLLLFPYLGVGQESKLECVDPESLGLSIDSLKVMSQHFKQLVKTDQLAGYQIAIVRGSQLGYFESGGHADKEENIEITDQTLFRIFSMTKPIVSVGIMQLVEKGLISLDDPVNKYIPSFKNRWTYNEEGDSIPIKNDITIKHLLTHTSGLCYGRSPNKFINKKFADSDIHNCADNKAFVEKLSEMPLSFEPGTNWAYSYATNICGHLIEIVSGKNLDVYLKENILIPLGMNNTFFQVPSEKIEHFTVGYGADENHKLTIREPRIDNRYTNDVTLFNGGGDLVSSMHDYIKFCQMLSHGWYFDGKRILNKESIDLMTQNHLAEIQIANPEMNLPSGEPGFGLGFAVNDGVYGWGGAVGTYFRIDKKRNLFYILMIQLSPYQHLNIREVFQDFVVSAVVE